MTKWIRVSLVLGAVVVLAGLMVGAETWAQEAVRVRRARGSDSFQFGGRGGFGREQRMGARLLAVLDNDRVKTALGLNDDQSSRLRQIVVDTQKSNIKTGADMAVRGIELRELLRADNPDHDAVMKKVDQIAALRSEMIKQDVEALLSAKSVLTPEQQKKIRTFIEHRRAAGFMGGGAFGRHGAGPGERRFGAHPWGGPGAPDQPKSPDSPPQQP